MQCYAAVLPLVVVVMVMLAAATPVDPTRSGTTKKGYCNKTSTKSAAPTAAPTAHPHFSGKRFTPKNLAQMEATGDALHRNGPGGVGASPPDLCWDNAVFGDTDFKLTRAMCRKSRRSVGDMQQWQPLLEKLRSGQCINVAAIGGSVTCGTGLKHPKRYAPWLAWPALLGH